MECIHAGFPLRVGENEDEEMGTHIPTATKQHLLDHIAGSQLPLELSRPTDTLGDFLAAKVAAQ